MGKLRDAKILGGIGAILLLLSFIPFVSIIGIVLMFIAVKYISDETKDKDIFKNYLYSFHGLANKCFYRLPGKSMGITEK